LGEDLQRKPGSGAKCKIVGNDLQRVSQLAHHHQKLSSAKIGELAEKRGSPLVHPNTILNTLKYLKWVPTAVPTMTKAHKEKCLKWCLDNQKRDWSMVIFTDESYFQLFRNKVREWTKSRPQKPTPKHGPSFMVWGGIGTRGTTTLEIARGSINATRYQDILSTNLEPSMAVICPDGYVLQQDNATPLKAKSTKK
jgi:hypothetical protein